MICDDMVLYGIAWCVISYNIIWYHMIKHHIKWYHMISYDIASYHMISYDMISYIIWYHIPYHITSHHMRYHMTYHMTYQSVKLCFQPSKIATVTNCDTTVAICDLSQFVIKAVTAQTESNNIENVFWVLGRVPRFTYDIDMKSCIFAHFGVISLLYLFVCMYLSYKAHNRFTKETLLIVSDVDVYMFPALRSIPSCTTDMNLRSCILNRHKLRQSQIATIQESLPSHFVICRILWSWPWRHKLSPITLKTCSGYLGEYPCSLLTWIWKVSFLPVLALFHCYIWLCVCISVIKPIIDLQRKPYW